MTTKANQTVTIRTDALELFSQNELDFSMFKAGERKNNDGKVTGLSLALQGRKAVAKTLGLGSKDSKVMEAMLKASDQLKTAAVSKMAAIATSPDWTGKGVRTSLAKDGTLTATFAFKTVKRGPAISRDQLAAALATMSDEEQTAILNAAEDIKMQAQPVPVLDNSRSEPESANA